MTGRIIKGIAGFYYVKTDENQLIECKARGLFRKQKMKPAIGDLVTIVLSDDEKTGYITEIQERQNWLIRPPVANVDQALVMMAVRQPEPHLMLLDRFITMIEMKGITPLICFNKIDLVEEKAYRRYLSIYQAIGYPTFAISTKNQWGFDSLLASLRQRTTVLAGPSGVGKSSLINGLRQESVMPVGELSDKLNRGKHTTRHVELIEIDSQTFVADTPGFSSLTIESLTSQQLAGYYIEFRSYQGGCRFRGCRHLNEQDCGIKQAVENGNIALSRYDSYRHIYQELEQQKKY